MYLLLSFIYVPCDNKSICTHRTLKLITHKTNGLSLQNYSGIHHAATWKVKIPLCQTEVTSSTLRVKEAGLHSLCFVTWVTRTVLAWQSSVTTVKPELWWTDMRRKALTHVTWRTLVRVWLNWQVWRECPTTVSSSSSTSVTIHYCCGEDSLGWSHVMVRIWRTGVGPLLAATNARAVWITRVQTQVVPATVTRMTRCGVKTAVSSLTSPTFQCLSSDLGTQAVQTRKATTHSGSWSAMDVFKNPSFNARQLSICLRIVFLFPSSKQNKVVLKTN